MSKIKIRNFGPIKNGLQSNDGWIDINKVTIFIGNQGSGKSTVAKLFSILSWLEKSINKGDTNKDELSLNKLKKFAKYQKIHNYFNKNTYIEYIGEKYKITYDSKIKYPIIQEVDSNYIVPKIMYIPAERNFLSTISDAYDVKGLPDNVFTFAEELKKAQKALNGKKLDLQIGSYKYQYDESEDSSFVLGDDYKINLLEASSGLQSFTPLYLVSRNLSLSISDKEETLRKNMSVSQSIRMNNEIAELMLNKSIPDENTNIEINKIRSRYYNRCFINIVEEPEQNLFPESQWLMLKKLLEFNNLNIGNSLLITTHSPYIINYLSVVVKANQLKLKTQSKNILNKINTIVPLASTFIPENLRVYEFDEKTGIISILNDYKGLPSDENYLNLGLANSNELFSNLLDIEDLCQ